jgi:Holliday junction DNA helicase RuvA
MIALITGTLKRKAADYLIVDVSGVGYQVQVPLSTLCGVPEPGGEVTLHIHTHLREDALSLFGFLTPSEKDMFLLLMSVSGIGPKLALSVLSSLSVSDLASAIRGADLEKLATVPGIGKKSAGRIALELKDKLTKLDPSPMVSAQMSEGTKPDTTFDDALSALVNLGYRPQDAKGALQQVKKMKPDSLPLKELIRDSLKELARG